MKKTMFLFAAVVLLAFFCRVQAQENTSANTTFRTDLQNVIRGYFNHFQNETGEELISNPQSIEYASLIKIAGAQNCVITKYSSRKKEVYSFNAVMLETDDFEVVKKQFKNLFNAFNNTPVRLSPNHSFQLKGVYESPEEEKAFTSIIFKPMPADESVRHLQVELSLEAELMQWKIKVSVYEKDRKDDEPAGLEDGE
ncbi:MAG TPA: hypothetical protein VFS36_13505 [Chitinophagaceae bacterium]|jgi:hypothetical protein|nr:hypothetical protein [Chitinophagaceae bacterium]